MIAWTRELKLRTLALHAKYLPLSHPGLSRFQSHLSLVVVLTNQSIGHSELSTITAHPDLEQWLLCLQVLSVHKEYNLNRQYTQHHSAKYQEFVGQVRATIEADFKRKSRQETGINF
ncbi:unnamed protein product [Timema podura]|uniref:Uncharacterized protein n=1 Tax=Timema podura TaxID=61482 RepID=A0ABN7PH80_TIMPD|nr:unnamed protein product [Timema podura]